MVQRLIIQAYKPRGGGLIPGQGTNPGGASGNEPGVGGKEGQRTFFHLI